MNKPDSSQQAATRQVPGRWLFAFPVLLLVAAAWFTVHPWQSSASSPVGQAFSEDLYSPDRYRVLPDGMIEDTATGLVRKLDGAHVGSTPSAADIRAFISLTDDQRADLRNGVGARPVHLVVGAIGVDAEVIPIGLDVNRALAVPRDAQVTGWWSGGSVPGESGPTVIVGHFDSKVASGVFAKLQTLRKGARITIEDSEGSTYVYEVVEMEHLHKTAFPTQKVYGSTDSSTLRLVTCGGKFNRATGHYVDNTIAYAKLVSADIVGRPDPALVREDLPLKISPVLPVGSADTAADGLYDGPGEIVPGLSVEDFPALNPSASIDPAASSTIVGAPTFTVPVVLTTVPSGPSVASPSVVSPPGVSQPVVPPSGPAAGVSTVPPSSLQPSVPGQNPAVSVAPTLPTPSTVAPLATVAPISAAVTTPTSTPPLSVPVTALPESPEPAVSSPSAIEGASAGNV
jgi:Sortase domain